ncbi:MAG TPA: hypothetical protein VFT70_10495 [Nocardioides sp.]|nr:hypothetical protein [Nocardioides sp.]
MILGTGAEPLPAPPRTPRTRSGLELRWRWVLVIGWLALLVAAAVTGTRQATWQDLRTAVADRDVRSVSTTPGLGPEARGSTPVEVTWRDGVVRYRTEVREARPRRRAAPPRVVADVEDTLTSLQPGLTVTHHDWTSSSSQLLGWRVSAWFARVGIALGLFTLILLLTQPEPWRATRWAWFWLLWSPLGLAAYLVLSGPTGVLPAPRDERRRLTGGWAFLLAIVVSSASSALVRALP